MAARNESRARLRRGAVGLLAGLLAAGAAGCASIPDVRGVIERSEATPALPQIVGAKGPLTTAQSQAVVARLDRNSGSSDVLQHHLALETALAGNPVSTGNKVTLLRNARITIDTMFQAIDRARDRIDLEYFTVEDIEQGGQHLGDLLIEKRRQGLPVNLIYDGYGSIDTPSAFFDRLKQAGIKLVEFRPLDPLRATRDYAINDRDHRKILVVDGKIGIVGGVNLSIVYERRPADPAADPPWRDTDIEIEGPAVAELEKLFVDTWTKNGGPPLAAVIAAPSAGAPGKDVVRILGSTPDDAIPQYYVSLLSAIRNAESRIWLTAAYFVPTHDEEEALLAAARRGVDLQLLLPSHTDSDSALAVGRSHYTDLLKAGAKIYEYPRTVLHSKIVVVDGVWSTVGSSNFDHRSVVFNNEVDAVVLGGDMAAQIEAMFQGEIAHVEAIDLRLWEQRPLGERIQEMLSRAWQVLL
jgi:cardiolipin synthase A/B